MSRAMPLERIVFPVLGLVALILVVIVLSDRNAVTGMVASTKNAFVDPQLRCNINADCSRPCAELMLGPCVCVNNKCTPT